MSWWHSVLPAVAWLCLPALAGTASAQPTGRAWRETLQLNTPLLAAKRWENVQGLIEQQAWEAAMTALEELETEPPDDLINIAPGRYVSLPLAVRLLRMHLPPEGLEVYRRQIDGWADQQFQTADALGDDAALQRIVSTALASRAGDDALDRLAEHAWERGDISSARSLWTMMIPIGPQATESLLLRYPDTDHDVAALHARLILCSLAEGDVARAEEELLVFQELFADAEGTIAGEHGRLVELLQSQVDNISQWPTLPVDRSWPTFAGDPARNRETGGSVSLGRAVWTLPLKPDYVSRWERPRPALPERGLLSRYPVTYGEGLFIHDGTTIRGLRLSDGEPLWPLEDEDTSEATPGKVYPPFPAIPNTLPWTPIVGVPRHTMTVHHDRLYALMGPSVLTLPPGGQVASPTRLICLNLAEEGLLDWFHTSEDLFDSGWLVTGTPVASGEFLYVPLLRSEPQIEIAVACLRNGDGSVVWQRSIGQALREALAGRVELGHQLLSLADGQVFFSTDFGGVAALDAQSGRINWVVTYASKEIEAVDRSDEAASGLLPPLYHEGILFVKPNDADELLAIDARSGHVHWRRPVPGPIVHLLGASGSTLVVSGDQLWGIDVDTGRPQWRFGYDDAAGYGYGRGVIVGNQIFWPTREEMFLVDQKTGQLRRRLRLYEGLGVTGGNLCIGGNWLLIAGPNRLTALELDEVGSQGSYAF